MGKCVGLVRRPLVFTLKSRRPEAAATIAVGAQPAERAAANDCPNHPNHFFVMLAKAPGQTVDRRRAGIDNGTVFGTAKAAASAARHDTLTSFFSIL
ncbi:MAG: hypothetical protein ACRD2P_05295 [Terriglobia bacterium]